MAFFTQNSSLVSASLSCSPADVYVSDIRKSTCDAIVMSLKCLNFLMFCNCHLLSKVIRKSVIYFSNRVNPTSRRAGRWENNLELEGVSKLGHSIWLFWIEFTVLATNIYMTHIHSTGCLINFTNLSKPAFGNFVVFWMHLKTFLLLLPYSKDEKV